MFRCSFGKKHAAQPALSKGTGPAIIIAVHAVPLHQPEFKQQNEQYIQDEPDEADLVQDSCTNKVH
jgi:hypothetical protein